EPGSVRADGRGTYDDHEDLCPAHGGYRDRDGRPHPGRAAAPLAVAKEGRPARRALPARALQGPVGWAGDMAAAARHRIHGGTPRPYGAAQGPRGSDRALALTIRTRIQAIHGHLPSSVAD